jgi:tetratricopeptide (TPR) repeat protein
LADARRKAADRVSESGGDWSESEVPAQTPNDAPHRDASPEDELDLDDELDIADANSPATSIPSDPSGQTASIAGKRILLVGRLGSMNRREAANVLQSYKAAVVEMPRSRAVSASAASTSVAAESGGVEGIGLDWGELADWIVIGAEVPPLSESELLPKGLIDAAGRGDLEIIHETELWQRTGLVELDQSVRRYYTPAMLADLLRVSVRVVRRWHRLGLITPVVTLHKLPYFDYAEVASAKRLAGWIAAGASPRAIERRLVELVQVLPGIRRPLDQLSILVEGKQVLLRQGDGLVEPGGQLRFDFEALDDSRASSTSGGSTDEASIVAFELPDQPPMLRAVGKPHRDPILAAAYAAEDADDLETAIDLYHTILARDGARADISFQIGELLYRMNFLVAARERYYIAIEIDPDFVEARASLGAVLAELGQTELALAALRGALSVYDDYADVHFTLAKTLDKIGQTAEALPHWKRILELAPESSWADEARERLGE